MVHFAFVVKKLMDSVEALADLKQLFSLAEKYGYSEWIQFDSSTVRCLAYYTVVIFEVKFINLFFAHFFLPDLKLSQYVFGRFHKYAFQIYLCYYFVIKFINLIYIY